MFQHRPLFGKKNFIIVLIGIALILAGYLLMVGGASTDPNIYPEADIYGFRRTILAPFIILVGFAVQVVAIFYQDTTNTEIAEETPQSDSNSVQAKKSTAKTARR